MNVVEVAGPRAPCRVTIVPEIGQNTNSLADSPWRWPDMISVRQTARAIGAFRPPAVAGQEIGP